jgi:hypothetical protein
LLILILGVSAFYSFQFNADSTIHWDAVDVHYSSQAYFSTEIRGGSLPFWTSALFSGFPFLADPQVGAWYPLNWPFFLAGITPRSIQLEVALHSLIACLGAYYLAWRLIGNGPGAICAGFVYGLSGFFAGHAQHVGMFQAAAWFPWLLLGVDAIGNRLTATRVALVGLLGGSIILVGHFQTALYDFAGATLFASVDFVREPNRRTRLVLGLTGAAVLALGLSAVASLPGLELAHQSVRARLDASTDTFGLFRPEGLLTLI